MHRGLNYAMLQFFEYTSSPKLVCFSPLITLGNTQIGSRFPENNHDIQLKGNLVAEDHW